MKYEQIFHIYRDLCPDKVEPNLRDPACPACQLLADYDRLTAGLGELEKGWRIDSRNTRYDLSYRHIIEMCADELAALLRGNDG